MAAEMRAARPCFTLLLALDEWKRLRIRPEVL